MNDLRLVEIVKAAEHVIDDGFDLLFFKVLGGLEQLLEVHIALVKHEVHIIKVFLVLRLYDTLHLVEARVLDASQDAHLSEQALCS
jgi:ABC-type spermidine/putrescine transport system permease subunit I